MVTYYHTEKIQVNIKEIAKRAGVSVASVSRALQAVRPPNISEELRKKILAVCAENHYYPDIHTKRMFSGKSGNIALFANEEALLSREAGTNLLDYNFGAVLIGAQNFLSARGTTLQIVTCSRRFLEEREYRNMIRSRMFDGILVWGVLAGAEWIGDLLPEKIPVVQVSTSAADCFPSVTADEYSGMRRTVGRLFSAGHTRAAVIRASAAASSGDSRNRAVDDAFRAAGLSPVWISPSGGFGYEFGKRMTELLLDSGVRFTALSAPNDMAACGAAEVLRGRGFRIPGDVSLTGADGIPVFNGGMRTASFYLPSFEMGAKAAELVLALGNGEHPGSSVLRVGSVRGNTIKKIGTGK